jgi:hypothetical protein
MDQSNTLLANEGIEDKTTANKVVRIIFRAFSIIYNIYSVLMFPVLLIPVIGWIYYLIERLFDWAVRYGEEYFMRQQSKDIIAKLAQLKKETKSKEVANKCDSIIKSMNNKIDKMESENESYDPLSGIEESYDPWADLDD